MIHEFMRPPRVKDEVGAEEWADAESFFGSPLPSDYRRFVSEYGEGIIDCYLSILTPRRCRGRPAIVRGHEEYGAVLRSIRADSPSEIPHEIHPARSGLIVWGTTTDADVCCWETSSASPEEWNVVINSRHFCDTRTFEVGFAGFILAVLSGSADRPFHRKSFPERVEYFSTSEYMKRVLASGEVEW